MWRIEQTRFGAPEGNCIAASYASLLETPLGEIPSFRPPGQRGKERRWLRTLGYDLVVVPVPERGALPSVPDDVYHLMSGRSPRDRRFGHRVVGRGGHLAWDPHPSHDGLAELDAFLFVVPLF